MGERVGERVGQRVGGGGAQEKVCVRAGEWERESGRERSRNKRGGERTYAREKVCVCVREKGTKDEIETEIETGT